MTTPGCLRNTLRLIRVRTGGTTWTLFASRSFVASGSCLSFASRRNKQTQPSLLFAQACPFPYYRQNHNRRKSKVKSTRHFRLPPRRNWVEIRSQSTKSTFMVYGFARMTSAHDGTAEYPVPTPGWKWNEKQKLFVRKSFNFAAGWTRSKRKKIFD